MADSANKQPENVAGSWYVDDQCIDCSLCRDEAPDWFTAGDGHSFVHKQPAGDDETAAATAAMEACPVEAIGNDGA